MARTKQVFRKSSKSRLPRAVGEHELHRSSTIANVTGLQGGDEHLSTDAEANLPPCSSEQSSDSRALALHDPANSTIEISNVTITAETVEERNARLNRQRVRHHDRKSKKAMLRGVRKNDPRAIAKYEDLKQRNREKTARRRQRLKNAHLAELGTPSPSLEARILRRQSTDAAITYTTKQLLYRSVQRIRTVLPQSRAQALECIAKLAVEFGFQLVPLNESVCNKLDNDLNNLVMAFYESNDVSAATSGIRQVRVVVCNGIKERKQVRYLIYTTKEAHQLFLEKYPYVKKVGLTVFAALRPAWVIPRHKTPENVCVCSYHANLEFKLRALKGYDDRLPATPKEYFSIAVCDKNRFDCMSETCPVCRDPISLIEELQQSTDELQWYEWRNVLENGKKSYKKVAVTSTVGDLASKMPSVFTGMKMHEFIRSEQQSHFEICLQRAASGALIVVQCDFAENYRTIEQDVTQSAYYSYSQVTVFTVCIWGLDSGTLAMAFLTDDLSHDKISVRHFLTLVIEEIRGKQPDISKIVVFSDGAASQFKSKYALWTLSQVTSQYQVEIEWNYFASHHGKGAVDGIGATVKRAARAFVLSRRVQIRNAADLFTALPSDFGILCKVVNIEDLRASAENWASQWKNLAANSHLKIKKIHQVHVHPTSGINVKPYTTSEPQSVQLKTKPVPVLDPENDSDDENEVENDAGNLSDDNDRSTSNVNQANKDADNIPDDDDRFSYASFGLESEQDEIEDDNLLEYTPPAIEEPLLHYEPSSDAVPLPNHWYIWEPTFHIRGGGSKKAKVLLQLERLGEDDYWRGKSYKLDNSATLTFVEWDVDSVDPEDLLLEIVPPRRLANCSITFWEVDGVTEMLRYMLRKLYRV